MAPFEADRLAAWRFQADHSAGTANILLLHRCPKRVFRRRSGIAGGCRWQAASSLLLAVGERGMSGRSCLPGRGSAGKVQNCSGDRRNSC